MSNEGKAFSIKGLSFDDEAYLFGGNFDPSVSGYQAPTGAYFFRDSGQIYTKDGALDTDWVLAGATGGAPAHNDTTGKQGGVPGEYYHLSAAELSNFNSHLTDNTNPHDTTVVNLFDTLITSIQHDETIVWDSGQGKFLNKEIAVTPPDSGKLIQLKFGTIAGQSGTTLMPDPDVNEPTITDGTEIWTEAITPTATNSEMRISSTSVIFGSNSSTRIVVAAFRGSTLIGVTGVAIAANNTGTPMAFTFYDEPNTTSPVTYSCRIGKYAGGTWYINQFPGVPLIDAPAVQQNAYSIEEIGLT